MGEYLIIPQTKERAMLYPKEKRFALFAEEIRKGVADAQEQYDLAPTVAPTKDMFLRATGKHAVLIERKYGILWGEIMQRMGLRQQKQANAHRKASICWSCKHATNAFACIWVRTLKKVPDGAEFKAGNGILSCPNHEKG
ncbi:MAG: hypothetical protein ACOX3W_00505 [Christensenellaceae bacterium]